MNWLGTDRGIRQRLVGAAAVIALGLGVLGCVATTPKDSTAARAAVHAGDFGPMFQAMALEVKKHYPNLAARPHERAIKTAWHPLPIKESKDSQSEQRWGNRTDGKDETSGYKEFSRNATGGEVRFFVRFDIRLVEAGAPGSNQWRVEVLGQASRYDPAGVPTPLVGDERPYWLDNRIASLEIALFERLKQPVVAAR